VIASKVYLVGVDWKLLKAVFLIFFIVDCLIGRNESPDVLSGALLHNMLSSRSPDRSLLILNINYLLKSASMLA
jgi:hypothetical protein